MRSEFYGISVIIPVKGDKKVSRTVQSVLSQRIKKCEIFIIRNSHISYEIEDNFPDFYISPYCSIKQILLDFSGKAKAINYGIKHARYCLIAIVDADCILADSAFDYAIEHFRDKSVIAVGGKLIVLPHAFNLLTAIQSFEYSKTFNISRNLLDLINCNYIISGAFGIFRKKALLSIGGYDEDSVGEDLEVILRSHRLFSKSGNPFKIVFEPRSICFTEAPRTIKALLRQRERWQRGFLDSVTKNIELLFNKNLGILGMLVLPWFCLEAIAGPIGVLLGVSGVLDSTWGVYISIVYLAYQVAMSVVAELIEKKKEKIKIVPFICKALIVNFFGMLLQPFICLARLFGTLFFKKRRMKW